MATEQRAGFRLPWTSDQRPQADEAAAEATSRGYEDMTAPGDSPNEAADRETEAPRNEEHDPLAATSVVELTTMTAAPDAVADPSTERETVPVETSTGPGTTVVTKRPSRFLADLTKAMQAAAESARSQTLGQFQADAKAFIEEIHSRSAGQASELRKRTDDDIAAIREWSKAEIARIRDLTEQRITGRKAELETELEQHAATIEHRIDEIQRQVATFEHDMDGFFERLLAEPDPTRFAALAENLPEAPPFALDSEPTVVAGPETSDGPDELVGDGATVGEDAGDAPAAGQSDVDAESTLAAIQAAVEAAAHAELDAGRAEAAAERAEAAAEATTTGDGSAHDENPEGGPVEHAPGDDEPETDPRIVALSGADFDAAEAEAAAAASDDETQAMDEDALTARLGRLVPDRGQAADGHAPGTGSTATTQVVVVGLVSVASIASFKRHLGRTVGVRSVGVSSGPDGEFVFSATHDADVSLREVVPTLPGFHARVTNSGDGIVNVTARDPESES
jgi:hypothetical protein